MKHIFRVLTVVVALTTVAETPGLARDDAVATTPHFAFYSDFATNLHDALLEAGRDRQKGGPELFRDGEEAACFAGLAPSVQTAWNLAVDFYAEVVSPKKWSDRQQLLVRFELARVEESSRERGRRYIGIVRGFMKAATPAYDSCRWKMQDARNRRWIEALVGQLKVHEETISDRLADLYDKPLGGLPIRVDVVKTVNWSGATTWILDPDGGHIVISIVEHGPLSLEYIFHEATHTLMGRGDPIQVALTQAADRLDVALPGDLWHAVLFYTTGDAVSRVLAKAGEPSYTPMLFAGNIFGRHHDAMKMAWTAYLNGDRDLQRAAEDLIRALGHAEVDRPE